MTITPDNPSSAKSAPWLRFNRAEAGGALGDLGTFIPLLVGMVTYCGLQLQPALFFAGLMNVLTGLLFGIPLAVQPMKAIAAVAIAEGLTEVQILVAGGATSAVILILALSGTIDWLHRRLPLSVIRGLQLALGLKLITSGVGLVATRESFLGWDGTAVGIGCVIVVLLLYHSARWPAALIVFLGGLILLGMTDPSVISGTRFNFSWRIPDVPDWNDVRVGILRGALPQIALTTLNSVIAVSALSADLFPHRSAAPRPIAVSVGLMNLICCPLGAMPMCHGAGGLAAQYRFGARTGGSVVLLGAIKMILALLFGGSLLIWLEAYPQAVLGVLLMFSGLELAMVARDQSSPNAFFVLLVTVGVCLATNTAIGFLFGWAVAIVADRGLVRVEPRIRRNDHQAK